MIARVFPVLLLVCVITIIMNQLRRHMKSKWFKLVVVLIGAIYVFCNLQITIFSRAVYSKRTVELRPFITYVRMFCMGADNPNWLTEVFIKDTSPLSGIMLNVLLYYPLGYLLYVLRPTKSLWFVVVLGIACSSLTECAQYFFELGWFEMDDIIHNSLGIVIGAYIAYIQANVVVKHSV